MPYRSIEDPAKLRRLLEATLLLEGDLDLPSLLRHIIEEGRSMTNARYGALGVLNDEGTALSEFVTAGLDPDQEERIGARPTGRGVLGLLISHPRPIRLAQLGSHTDSFGFPPNHPAMHSFLGMPIKVRDAVYGNLYLTDKMGWSEFTSDDEALVGTLAVAAGIAIENARLHKAVGEVAVFEERDRMARDLHDTVIQRLFAIGLSLQSMASSSSDGTGSDHFHQVISDIDDTIRQVRTTIFELGSEGADRGLRDEIHSLLEELEPVVGFAIPASFDGPVDTAVPAVVKEQILAVVREGVTNIGRHAGAIQARVTLSVNDEECRLVLVDDGRGIQASLSKGGGLGLGNLRRRAEKLHGQFDVRSPATGGTVLTWQVPLPL